MDQDENHSQVILRCHAGQPELAFKVGYFSFQVLDFLGVSAQVTATIAKTIFGRFDIQRKSASAAVVGTKDAM